MTQYAFIDALCEDYRARGYFPSAVVSVFNSQKTLHRAAYGGNQMEQGYRPVNTDTVYDVASLSKIATATQILQLIDQGALALETKVSAVLPAIAMRPRLSERLKDVTIYQLLTHFSGIIDWYPFYVQVGRDFYDVFESFIGDTPVMQKTVYSDMNFMLLGKVLEAVRQKSLPQCLADLKRQLGATHLEYLCKDTENMAPSSYGNGIEEGMCAERGLVFDGFRSKAEPVLGSVNDGNAHYFFGDVAGHAGVFADVDAYERIGRLYLTSDSALLARSMTEQEEGRGLGWQVEPSLFPEGCGHTGFTGTSIWVSKAHDLGVILFTNRLFYPERNPNATNECRRALHQAVLEHLG